MTGRGAATQSRRQQTTGVTLEDQQGMIHVLVITTVEEAELLLPVCWIVGGIDIEPFSFSAKSLSAMFSYASLFWATII